MLRQFSYDQESVNVQGDTYFLNALMPKNRFVVEGRAEVLPNPEKTFCPGLDRESEVQERFCFSQVRSSDGWVCLKQGRPYPLSGYTCPCEG